MPFQSLTHERTCGLRRHATLVAFLGLIVGVSLVGVSQPAAGQTAVPTKPSSELVEALKSADVLAAQMKFSEASGVLEPFVAQQPDNRSLQFQFMRYQWQQANQILSRVRPNLDPDAVPSEVTPEQIRQALALMRRALGIRRASFEALKAGQPTAAKFEAERLELWANEIVRPYSIQQIGFLGKQPAEIQESIVAIRNAHQADSLDRFELHATLVVKDPLRFPVFTRSLSDSGSSSELRARTRLWLEVRERVGDVPHSLQDTGQQCHHLESVIRVLIYKPHGNRVDPDADARVQAAQEILSTFQQHSDPAIHGYGRAGRAWLSLKNHELTFAKFAIEMKSLREWLQQRIQDAPLRTVRQRRFEMYSVWSTTLDLHSSSDLGEDSLAYQQWQQAESLALVDFMLSRQECFPRAGDSMSRYSQSAISRDQAPIEVADRLKKLVALVDLPECRYLEEESNRVHHRDRWHAQRIGWLQKFPELAEPGELVSPWKAAKKLWDGASFEPARGAIGGIESDGIVYVLSVTGLNGKMRLGLDHVPTNGTPLTTFLTLELDPAEFRRFPRLTLKSVATNGRVLIAAVPANGVAVFDMTDGTSKFLTDDKGNRIKDAHCVSLVDDTVYVGFGSPGSLVAYDLATFKSRVLFAGGGADNPEALRDIPELRVLTLQADLARERLVFSLAAASKRDQRRNFENQNPGGLPQTGLWEFNFRTGEFRQLVPMLPAIPDWSEPINGKSMLFVAREFVLQFDPTTDQIRPLRTYLSIPLNEKIKLADVPARGVTQGVVAVVGDELWMGVPLTRVSLATGKTLLTAALARPNADQSDDQQSVLMQTLVPAKKLVYGNRQAIWLLDLP